MNFDKNEKFQVEWLLKQITPRGNGKTLKTARPKDGVATFVWRMCRFHSGMDYTNPTSCYFYLANQMEKDGEFENFACTFFGPEEKEVLDKLDSLVTECCTKLGLSDLTAAQRFQGILY